MPVEVAAAVIERADGGFLLARRPSGKVYAGWWEFPGGKVHAGERPREALARELDEELGIAVRRAYPWIVREHAYAHAHVRLHFYRVVAWAGEPRAREHDALAWCRLDAPLPEPMLPANAPVLAALRLPLEYAITDAARIGVEASLAALERRLAAGLRLVQVRDRQLPGRERFARQVVALAHRHGARVLVAGGPAIADGVHYSASELMRLASRPQGGLAAASCHTRKELERAIALGMDFAVLGPVKETPTHPEATPLGWARFAEIVQGASIPVYAIGGLWLQDLDEARRAGAHGLAMIRGAWAG
ncbi:MAG: Nudix family hydrolase [Burkholderiales bacterium]|nr:Nudix family hydrolase [Burkholderiales bacterium]